MAAALVLSIDVGRKNLALCALRPGACPRGSPDVVVHWTVTACDPTAPGVARALAALPWVATCDDVVIERQPNKNATMTRLQHYLEMYFAMRDVTATVQDAKHKLAFAAATPWFPTAMPDNWTYHTRKKLSVQTAAKFVEDTAQELAPAFAAAAKKDDMADSLLQGMAFCHAVRPLELAKRTATPRVVPRRPTAAQAASAKYSRPNVVYLLARVPPGDPLPDKLRRAAEKHFGAPDAPLLVESLQAAQAKLRMT